ncbi:MAG: hypothetical protein EP297_12510 [Gammaproteobacteria bacterium]|nr:MAG: hypothetical protein EP297_12510 [Gammaproteobacteria bacterium]
MAEENFAYHVVYAGVIAGETRFGSKKVVTPVAFDNEEIILQVAQQIKQQKHFLEVTIINWIPLKA